MFATTGILGDVTSNVIGDLADVKVLMPAGADPHDFEPSARQLAELAEADLVIANGLGLEAGLEATLDQVAEDGVAVFEVGPELAPIEFGDAHDHDEADPDHDEADPDHDEEGTEDDDHAHGDLDPHVWLDPDRMASAAARIGEEVASATGLPADELADRAAAYQEELLAADEEIQAMLAAIPDDDRQLVTNHESLGYFAERYGFSIVGVVIPGGSTESEPSAAGMAELAETVAELGVPAIFADTSSSDALARTLADEVGAEVVVVELYTESLGEPGSGADSYVGLLTTNARRIADALS